MTDVYECKLCGMILMRRGFSIHARTVHGLTRDDYDTTPESRDDLVILCDGHRFKKGKVVGKWLFEVDGDYKTIFRRGNIRAYRLWVSERIRYVNNKFKASLRTPTYLDDYRQ